MKMILTLWILSGFCFAGFTQFGDQVALTESYGYLEEPILVDLNGDNKPDLLSGWYDNPSRLQWNENLGNGKFSTQQIISNDIDGLGTLTMGDLTGDGQADIIFGAGNADKIGYYEVHGDGTFGQETIVSATADNVYEVRSIDINDDGKFDVVAKIASGVYWYENLGGGIFGTAVLLPTITGPFIDANTSDLDGDGLQDIVYANDLGPEHITWFKNLGGGNFGTEQVINSGAGFVDVFNVVDLDQDLDLDIITSGLSADIIFWQENLGGGMFGPNQLVGNINAPYETSAVDLDGDNDLDIVAGNSLNMLVWYENLGSEVFATEQIISTLADQVYFVGSGDMDADGDMDVYSGSDNDDEIAWYQNDGNGNFGPQLGIQTKFTSLGRVFNVDFDGDGDIDIVTGGGYDGKKIWFENYGSDKFVSERVITTSATNFGDPHCADLDQDLDIDYIFTMGTGDSIFWYENEGNCIFTNYHLITNMVDGVSEIKTADMDADGDLDLLSTSTQDDKVAWYENLGGGNFGPQVVISVAANTPKCVVPVDLDNDGDLDVVSTSMTDDKVAFYENVGGTFGPQQVISTALDEAWALDAGDVDGDGDADIVASASWGNKVSWFENYGGLVFGPEQIIATGISNIWDLSLQDLDNDGDKDVVYLSYSWSLHWNENTGSGNFGPTFTITGNLSSSQNLDVADFDQDGDLDISTSSNGDWKIARYENLLYSHTQIKGRMFADMNQNLVHDSTDIGIATVGVVSSPASDFSFTFANGNYFMNFSDVAGTYTIQPQALNYWSIVTDSLSYQVIVDTAFAGMDSLDFGFFPDTIIHELNPELVGGFPRCNQTVNYWLSYQNTGTTIPSGILSLQLADSLTYISSVVPPDSIVGQMVYWSYDSLLFFYSGVFDVQVLMPDFQSMGDELLSVFMISVIDTNGVQVYSVSDSLFQTVVCAYDPNDKIAEPAGIDSLGFIDPNTEEIEYTIRFQNTGNDTALTVVIKDQLDPNLNWQSFVPLAASHSMTVAGNQDGKITFTFNSILLPDSNVNEPASHGFVKYRINLLPGVPVGTTIENKAEIYFDLNPPVVTNNKMLTLYDCDQILQMPAINSTVFCFGDTLAGNVNLSISNAQYQWIVEGADTLAGSFISWPADTSGFFSIDLTAWNNFCFKDTSFSINVWDTIPVTDLGTISTCEGDSVFIFSEYYGVAGIYYDSLVTVNGCDSILVQEVQIFSLPLVSFDALAYNSFCTYYGPVLLSANPIGGTYSGPGVSGNQFNPSTAGTGTHYLHYHYTDGNGCSGIDSVSVVVNDCLSVDENNPLHISVYPNPFNDFTTIYFGQKLNSDYHLHIYNMLGEVVYSASAVTGSTHLVQRNQMPAGIYILKVTEAGTGSEVYVGTLSVQ
ncbi:MAG: VCBS repeat-containing protein [Bacteroidetes bacterium]|nr:VCBS repeat-containing protein [Bacteroidota bacterium]